MSTLYCKDRRVGPPLSIDRTRTPSSKVHCLPVEILRQIFLYCVLSFCDYRPYGGHQFINFIDWADEDGYPISPLPEDDMYKLFGLDWNASPAYPERNISPSFATMYVTMAPWSLSYVCKLWRSVAVGSPELWTAVDLDFTRCIMDKWSRVPRRLGHGPDATKLLATYLERSRGRPLTVALAWNIGWCRQYEDEELDTREIYHSGSNPILQMILEESSRFEHLILANFNCGVPSTTFASHSYPILESLALLGTVMEDRESDQTPIFHDAPQLRTLGIANSMALKGRSSLPFSQITTFIYRGTINLYNSAEPLDSMLSNLPNLVDCTLAPLCTTYDEEHSDGRTPLEFPSLQRLTLSPAVHGESDMVMLTRFYAPALEKVVIHLRQLHEIPSLHLVELFQRSGCTVFSIDPTPAGRGKSIPPSFDIWQTTPEPLISYLDQCGSGTKIYLQPLVPKSAVAGIA